MGVVERNHIDLYRYEPSEDTGVVERNHIDLYRYEPSEDMGGSC